MPGVAWSPSSRCPFPCLRQRARQRIGGRKWKCGCLRLRIGRCGAALGIALVLALYTDSQYLKNGITKWMAGWKRRGWKKADGQPVLNQDLWQELDALYSRHDVTIKKEKGHVGAELNERCDRLSKREAMH